ncbi:hypothetical protein DFJ43DRAFT_1228014 [Lentinula guzmanii]|uniref:Aminoglycoside phosphotransferase domain-containing protein n=1 Tax=Lentinula guzmanii TaxID=2804957 RepID=A0AA38J2S3_9AGAR|nr:hypothetical protein DFJ43DRAFT_1228014 [Lentinula guzmanii]
MCEVKVRTWVLNQKAFGTNSNSTSNSPIPHDVGAGWELREDGIEIEDLQMDPADLAEFSSVELFRDLHPRMYWVDRDKVLKLFSYLIDVSVIVANMDLAGTRIPVPRVLRYGYSGNCSYILMEKIPHHNLAFAMLQWGVKFMPWQLTRTMDYIVFQLANLGLSHNDLVTRNVLVDDNGLISAIIDWDTCTSHHDGVQYARKIRDIHYTTDARCFPQVRILSRTIGIQ